MTRRPGVLVTELDLQSVAARFGRRGDEFGAELATLERYARDGIVQISGSSIKIAAHAQAAIRVICAAFDRYLVPAASGHAPAI